MGGIDVCDVAKTMVRDAEAKLMGEIRGETVIEGNKAIKRFAAEAQ